nr:hypothetical protein [Tanacetum cinerariifolium]
MNQQREQETLLATQREFSTLDFITSSDFVSGAQSFDFRQLIGEICGTKVCEEQKQNMEDTMLELLEVCRQKELYCMHNNVDDLIGSALNYKLLSIYLKSQRLDKEKQEVKNIVEQPTKCRTRITESLQNFRVIHKMSSISNTDDKSLSNEDVSIENFRIYLNHLFDNEIISSKIDSHHFNAESDLIESLLNRDILMISYPKFDYLLEEFSSELAHIDPISRGIGEANIDLEEEIRLVENLLYDNSSPRPSKELNAKIADTLFESLSPSPIPVEDSDSHMKEIDLFLATDDLMLPGIKKDDYDSEGDIHFLEELLSNDSISLSENESSNFDHHDDPLFPRPPPEPPDIEVFFEPDSGVLTTKVVKGISEQYVLMPNILPTLPTFDPLYPML